MNKKQPAENFYHQPNSWTQGKMYYTPAEFDLVSIAISKIELGKHSYQIHIKELNEISGKEWNESHLYSLCNTIIRKPFERKLENGWEIYVAFTRFIFNRKTNVVEVDINDYVLRDLFEVKNNMTYQELRSVVALNKQHAKRIYGWASQFKSSGVCRIPLHNLKIMLGLKDDKEEKYQNIREFKRTVLKASCEEISEKTNLNVTFDVEKDYDKSVKNIIFRIEEKKNLFDRALAQLSGQKQDPTTYQLITAALREKDISEKIADKIARISTYPQLLAIMDEIKSKSYTNNPVKNIPAYIVNYYTKRLNLDILS